MRSGTDSSRLTISNPAAARRRTPRLWSGWINVVVGAVVMLATLPGRTQGLGLITEPMLRDLQIDRVTYATVNLWATLIGAIVCIPIGRAFDRAGLRAVTFALTVALAAVVWSMSRMAGGVLTLFLLVLATRAIGQSALSVASITAVGKSFGRQVGLAMGVYSVLLSVLFAAAFVAIGGSVAANGWRVAWAQIAYGLALVGAPLVLLMREPRAGASPDPAASDGAGDGVPLAAALRTSAFWIFSGGTALFGLASSGLGLFNEAVLAERGFAQQTYVTFLAASSIVALVAQFACGWLSLRMALATLLGIAMLVYGVGLAVLPFVATTSQLWIVALLVGWAGGMITVIFFAVWRQVFGAAHLGRIQGAAQMVTVLASAIGPLIFAYASRLTGSYAPALWSLAVCVLLLGAAAFRVRLASATGGT